MCHFRLDHEWALGSRQRHKGVGVAELLLARKGEVKARDNDGWTPYAATRDKDLTECCAIAAATNKLYRNQAMSLTAAQS